MLTSPTEQVWKNYFNGWTGLVSQLWLIVSFLSYMRSTEPVLDSQVSKQYPGSCLSLESITDPGSGSSSDPYKLLQSSLQYSSVGHSSSGLTFPLRSCDKSQTNTQRYLVKQHTRELKLVYPGYFLCEEKLGQEYFWVSQFKTTLYWGTFLTSQGLPKFRYLPITAMVERILITLLEK